MKTLAKWALAACLLFLPLTGVAQHGRVGSGPTLQHQVYSHNDTGRGHYQIQHRNTVREEGRFAPSLGLYRGRPYYGGLRIYEGVNIFPCSEFDFVNGVCYPYDYYYYPEWYSGFHVGINIR